MSVDDFDKWPLAQKVIELRKAKGLTQTELSLEFARVANGNTCLFTRDAIKRLECGKMIKLTRDNIVSLIRALDCKDVDKADILYLSDKNIFMDDYGVIDAMDKSLNRFVFSILLDVRMVLKTYVSNKDIEDLPQREMDSIMCEVFTAVIRERMRRR